MSQAPLLHASHKEHHAFLDLAGARCRLRANSLAVVNTLRTFVTRSGSESGLLIDVRVANRPDVRQPVHFRGMGHLVVAEYGANVFLCDLAAPAVYAWITESAAHDREVWSEQWIPVLVGILGVGAGVLPLHSACVVKNGRGVLIVGESMAGKSTFAVAMAKHGLQLLSDDWTYVHLERSNVVANGLGVPVKLLPDAESFFPELRRLQAATTLNGEVAFTATASQLNIKAASHCEVTAMVFLQRTPVSSPVFTRAAAGHCLTYVQNSVERLPQELRDLSQARERLISAVCALPGWHFQYCASPLQGAACAIHCLQSEGLL